MSRQKVEIGLKQALYAALVVVFVLIPVFAYLLEDWYAFWGHGLLAIIFGALLVYLKTRYYWDEN